MCPSFLNFPVPAPLSHDVGKQPWSPPSRASAPCKEEDGQDRLPSARLERAPGLQGPGRQACRWQRLCVPMQLADGGHRPGREPTTAPSAPASPLLRICPRAVHTSCACTQTRTCPNSCSRCREPRLPASAPSPRLREQPGQQPLCPVGRGCHLSLLCHRPPASGGFSCQDAAVSSFHQPSRDNCSRTWKGPSVAGRGRCLHDAP